MIPLRDSKRSRIFPWMTIGLILINLYAFYLEYTSPNLDLFIYQYSLVPELVNPSDPSTWYRFITAMFLHGGIFHLVSNLWFLWIFGDNVEERLGFFYVPIYLAGGIIGSLAQYFYAPESSIPIIGASGAVATVLGAYFIWFPRHTILTLVPIFFFLTVINIPAFLALAYWFFIQIFNGVASITESVATSGGVAYFAHVGGFLAGVITAFLYGRPTRDGKVHDLEYD